MSESSMKWYVLRTVGGKEKKAKEYLEKEIERCGLQSQVSQVLIPTEVVYVIKNGKRVSKEHILYSSYIFIQAELDPVLQNIIRNEVPNLTGFLTEKSGPLNSQERVPVPLRDSEVRSLLKLQDDAAQTEGQTIVNFNIGEAVKIIDGPFNGFDGTIEEIIEERSTLKVVVTIFGRKTPLELSFTQVTKE